MDDIEWEQVAEWADELRNAPRSEEAERKIYYRRYYVANRDRILARQRERRAAMSDEEKRERYDRWNLGRNREAENEKRNFRYHSDPEYRDRVLACQRERWANRTEEQRERRREVRRDYERRNRKRTNDAKREWRRRNPDAMKRYAASKRERMRRMREEDPEAYRAYLDRRNARARERQNAKKAAQTAGKEST